MIRSRASFRSAFGRAAPQRSCAPPVSCVRLPCYDPLTSVSLQDCGSAQSPSTMFLCLGFLSLCAFPVRAPHFRKSTFPPLSYSGTLVCPPFTRFSSPGFFSYRRTSRYGFLETFPPSPASLRCRTFPSGSCRFWIWLVTSASECSVPFAI